MPTTPPLRRRAVPAALLTGLLAVTLATSACGKVEADRGEIARNLGLAYAAYTTYVSEPAKAGQLGPSTPTSSPVAERAAAASHYATLALEAAREEAAPDEQLASFAQKIAAAGASLNAITQVLEDGRPSRAVVAGGTASLESLSAAARDRGLTIGAQTVSPADLAEPPAA